MLRAPVPPLHPAPCRELRMLDVQECGLDDAHVVPLLASLPQASAQACC